MLPVIESNSQFYGGSAKILDVPRSSVHPLTRVARHVRTYLKTYLSFLSATFFFAILLHTKDIQRASTFVIESVTQVSQNVSSDDVFVPDVDNVTLHIVIPTNKADVNLCKTLLGLSLLGYPSPTLVAWDENFENNGILGGGSHIAKVSRVLNYLNSLLPEQDEELVLMIDAFDIWFQLPFYTLVERFYSVKASSQVRLRETLGIETVMKNNLSQEVLFGAGKRCAPNQPQTVACYAIPESPLPDDLYANNTDTVIGHNVWYSNKQRYLNSGFIIGPARAMRRVFHQAWASIEQHPDMDPNDNGSHGSDFMYHGSDQSIFADMFGRQEWAREKLRVRQSGPDARPRSSKVLGTVIDNILEPSTTHETFNPDLSSENPYEFGMHLDYWSDFGHQTINSEFDAHWITYDSETPLDQQCGWRTPYGCPLRFPEEIPEDIINSTVSLATDEQPWAQRRLYTHICLKRIPIMIHHNGMKERREDVWPAMWYQPDARFMLSELSRELESQPPRKSLAEHKLAPRLESAGGAWTDQDKFMQWDELCPRDWDREIFRDQ